jgi:hypothetical protein
MHFNNIRMVNFPQRDNFSLDGFPFHRIVEFGFLVNFDGELFARVSMVTDSDDSVSSLPNDSSDLIFLNS